MSRELGAKDRPGRDLSAVVRRRMFRAQGLRSQQLEVSAFADFGKKARCPAVLAPNGAMTEGFSDGSAILLTHNVTDFPLLSFIGVVVPGVRANFGRKGWSL